MATSSSNPLSSGRLPTESAVPTRAGELVERPCDRDTPLALDAVAGACLECVDEFRTVNVEHPVSLLGTARQRTPHGDPPLHPHRVASLPFEELLHAHR